jgi:hypothetical protein
MSIRGVSLLDIKNYTTKKYDSGNDSIETLISLMNHFVAEVYGSSVAVDPDSIEAIDKLHAYVDVFYPEILENTMVIRRFRHIFFITADQINGKAIIIGPDRKTAINMLGEIKSHEIRQGEIKLMGLLSGKLSEIAEIRMSLTPVMEILGELIEKRRIILVSTKKSDMKRLKYFNEISDLNIFSYEYKYDACIIEPGPEFGSAASGGVESMFSYVVERKSNYMAGVSSLKPYLRTAYSYYSICDLAGSQMEVRMETLLHEYGKLYGKEPDKLKFKNYVKSLYDVGILKWENNKIKGNDEIFKMIIKS